MAGRYQGLDVKRDNAKAVLAELLEALQALADSELEEVRKYERGSEGWAKAVDKLTTTQVNSHRTKAAIGLVDCIFGGQKAV